MSSDAACACARACLILTPSLFSTSQPPPPTQPVPPPPNRRRRFLLLGPALLRSRLRHHEQVTLASAVAVGLFATSDTLSAVFYICVHLLAPPSPSPPPPASPPSPPSPPPPSLPP
eukprot:3229532-Rhodomonas_salina.1